MSINHFLDKIKGKGAIDIKTIMYLCIVMGAAIATVGLREHPVTSAPQSDTGIVFTQTPGTIAPNTQTASSYPPPDSSASIQKNFVASKSGKLYYRADCAGANRILPKNQVWFETAIEAQKLGYTLATSCK